MNTIRIAAARLSQLLADHLSPSVHNRLTAYCAANDEALEDVVVDAIVFHLDEVERFDDLGNPIESGRSSAACGPAIAPYRDLATIAEGSSGRDLLPCDVEPPLEEDRPLTPGSVAGALATASVASALAVGIALVLGAAHSGTLF